MQEVTVKPRSVFKHVISIEQAGKELFWNFCTRRKNISFGLFRVVAATEKPSEIVKLDIHTALSLDPTTTVAPIAHSPPPRSASAPFAVDGGGSNKLRIPSIGDNVKSDNLERKSTVKKAATLMRSASSSSLRSIDTAGKKLQRPRLEEPGLEEVIQIAHYQSAKTTIRGNFFITVPGTYVLVFDNRFSLNTSKKLFFFVAVKDVEPSDNPKNKEVEGWLLKKGKRSMQGFRRRWAHIDEHGTFSYYKSPGGESHGSIKLPTCAIHLDHDHLLVDIDSGKHILHFKLETLEEFERWTSIIQKFVTPESMIDSMLNITGSDHDNIDFHLSKASLAFHTQANLLIPLEPDIESIQTQVTDIANCLRKDQALIKDINDLVKSKTEGKSYSKELLALIATLHDSTNTSGNRLFNIEIQIRSMSRHFIEHKNSVLTSIQQIESAFLKCLKDNNGLRKSYGLELQSVNSFLPIGSSMMIDEYEPAESIMSARNEEFFDAESGIDLNRDSESSEFVQDHDGHSNMEDDDSEVGSASHSHLDSSIEMIEKEQPVIIKKKEWQYASPTTPKEVDDTTPTTNSTAKPRRTALPAPTCSMQNISIMSILRNNVGKDLSTVAMPIVLNEPINLLQKLCEELEYSELLDRASTISDPVDRICIVSGFFVSTYASTVHRAARKPFNPLLGETYECIREEKSFKYIAEKVSHHPPVMASYAESPNFLYYQDSLMKTKFWGKTMELNSIGTVNLEFPKLNEHYKWGKVTTSMRNIFASNRYLEHHGHVKIVSQLTGHVCELEFKESGFFSSADNEVTGVVISPEGRQLVSLVGRWDHSLNKFLDSSPNSLEIIWRANQFPSNFEDNYGFTKFAIELNELTDDLIPLLPNTDSRYRPDQRMYEEGLIDEAEKEKQRLELKQRETRKQMEAKGIPWTPNWFEQVDDISSKSGKRWQFKKEYFEQRGKFKPVLDLFS